MTDVSKHKAGKNQRCSGCFTVLKIAQTRVTRKIYTNIQKRLEQLTSAT